ncbi:MAG: hypothetical protein MGF17_10410 [Trichodesmium sp. MAG_R04]|nr:hypothetical protein [Trichodesmium sp. MAG_R04]
MVQTIQSQELSLRYLLLYNQDLQLVRDEEFFREWQYDLPEISNLEKELQNQVQEGYFNFYYKIHFFRRYSHNGNSRSGFVY